ncbi:alpha/beta-hydrolase [Aulographum hederae CBS 113979]|uniref:Alpha/beta-hydrolase n=1 Tax=Aulographum hederae CBS 113979 TaxID=1176131 RepID=A0A6G1H5F6_9PEZI|nr:alpha/beta-hydrolase [Aulographum hederae CBS 113979]
MATVHTQYLNLSSGEKIFYRSAGAVSSPTILLLHGFPTSSHQFRNLIPILAPKYRVLAPDFPSYGFTEVPATYTYTFASLAKTIGTFIQEVPNAPTKFTIYIFDYGAPIGLRIALSNPSAITAIIAQNGNAYLEGLGPGWAPIKQYWSTGSQKDRDGVRPYLTFETTRWQYEHGTKDPSTIAPESYTLDQALMDRPGNHEIQLDIFKDYENNLALYPDFQKFFRDSEVPLLATWGKNDLFFPPEGAEAYKRDLPEAEIVLLDAGHFAGETETAEIGERIVEFLGRKGIK